MAYTHFRYIAWEVPTATSKPNGPVEGGFWYGKECPAVKRLPVDDNVLLDAKTRLKRLAAVVDRAAKRVGDLGGDNENTLKVFIVPEFYFRPLVGLDDKDNAMAQDTYPEQEMFKIWGALDIMFQHPDFTHWLIVAGTVMWNRPDPFAEEGQEPKINYFNTALWVRGGPVKAPTHMVEKKLASNLDGVPQAFAPGQDEYLKPIYDAWFTRKQRVFSVDNVYMGLEICLDHYNSPHCRVLKTILNEWTKNEDQKKPAVSLHLLTAGGMPLKPASVAAKKKGYVLRNDGYANDPRSELRKVDGYKIQFTVLGKTVTGDIEDPSNLFGVATLSGPVQSMDVTNLNGDELVPMKGNPYVEFPQRIVIYPTQPLP